MWWTAEKKENDLETGFKVLQGSTHPSSFMKVDTEVDVLERVKDLGLGRSRAGFKTQFRSPPKIRQCVFKFGREKKSTSMKFTSSQLGA